MIELKEIDPQLAPMGLLLEAVPSKLRIKSYLHGSWCFAAYKQSKIIAVCIVKQTSPEGAELFNIAVDSETQTQGVGTKLLTFTLNVLQAKSIKLVELGTGTFGHQLAFYQRQGFRVNSIIKDFFVDNYNEPIIENGIQHKDMLRLACHLD
jgi:ribosomal protein S18 acetylase RimI-like enzyme